MALGLGSIVNTLANTPEGVMTLMQAQQAAEAQRLAEQTRAASTAAQQAETAYQGAASAPLPSMPLLAAAIPSLFSTLASHFTKDPSWRQGQQEMAQQGRAETLKARADNLQALRDVWAQKAAAAKEAGDTESELKSRMQMESLSKRYDLLQQELDRQSRMEITKAEQAGDEKRALITAAALEDRAKIAAQSAEERTKMSIWQKLTDPYVLAGKPVPPDVVQQGRLLGVIPMGTPDTGLPGARKPTAFEIRQTLIKGGVKGVAVLDDDKFWKQRGIRERMAATKKGVDRKAARGSMKNFDLNTRLMNETPLNFISRLQSVADPLNPKKRLYSDEEIKAAGKRLFTAEEQEVQ